MYFLISVAGARPVSLILPSAPACSSARAAAGRPMPAGMMMPLRFGNAWTSASACCWLTCSLSCAVGDLDELHLGEFRIARHLLLHEVDPGVLVGRGRRRGQDREFAFVADQVCPMALEHHLGQAVALRLVDEERAAPTARRRSRTTMTFTPCFAARLSAGATALASLPAMAITPTFWTTRLLMNSICASAVACDGASWMTLAADLLRRFFGAVFGDLEIGVGVELRQEADVTGLVAHSCAEPPEAQE